jgi:hypothetical protein
MVKERSGDEMEDCKEDGDRMEVNEIKDSEVEEVQGKGKGKEKATEENTLA